MPVCAFYLRNLGIRGEACRFSHQTDLVGANVQVPEVCPHFLRGGCRYGEDCRSLHPAPMNNIETEFVTMNPPSMGLQGKDSDETMERSDIRISAPSTIPTTNIPAKLEISKPCKYFAQGQCSKGDTCSFAHTPTSLDDEYSDTPSLTPSHSSPAFPDSPIANERLDTCHFSDQGQCKNGAACPFLHTPTNIKKASETEYTDQFPEADHYEPSYERTLSSPSSAPVYEPCEFLELGRCTKGDACPFHHGTLTPGIEGADTGYTAEPPMSEDFGQGDQYAEGWSNEIPSETSQVGICKFYSQGNCARGEKCRFIHEVDSTGAGSSNPGITMCKFFASGQCKNGNACKFPHVAQTEHYSGQDNEGFGEASGWGDPSNSATPACKYFMQGLCQYGHKCRFRHDTAGPPTYPSEGWPHTEGGHAFRVDPSSRPCIYFAQGSCKKGADCTFLHDPTSTGEIPAEAPWSGSHVSLEDGWQSNGNEGSSWAPHPQPRSRPRVCLYFSQGNCKKGDACSFRHETQDAEEISASAPEREESHSAPDDGGWGPVDDDPGNEGPDTQETEPQETANDGGWGLEEDDEDKWGLKNLEETEPQETGTHGWGQVDGNAERWGAPPQSSTSATGICRWFRQGNCLKGDACRYSHDLDAERSESSGGPRWGQENKNWSGSSQNVASPTRACYQYLQGTCRRGDACRFLHEDRREGSSENDDPGNWGDPSSDTAYKRRICQYFNQGCCRKGDACYFRHAAVETNNSEVAETQPTESGWPPNDDEATWSVPWSSSIAPESTAPRTPKPCTDFRRGHCRMGDTCHYSHIPQDPLLETNADSAVDSEQVSDASDSHEDTVKNTSDTASEAEKLEPADGGWAPNAGDEDTWSTPWSNAPAESTTPPQVLEPCMYFGQGHCSKGDECRYLHIAQDAIPQTPVDDGEQILGDGAAHDIDEATQEPDFIYRSICNCAVQFGPGAAPLQIDTAFESRLLILSNLPSQISQAGIIQLTEPFGTVIDITTDLPVNNTVIARIEFAESAGAKQAAQSLNNRAYQSTTLDARLDLTAVIENITGSLSRKVKLSWYAPSRVAWVYYPTIPAAKAEGTRLDGMTFEGRKIKASFPRPRRGQTHSFAVRIEDLPLHVDSTSLKDFCVGASLVHIGEPSYDQSPIDDIHGLLTQSGHLDALEILPTASANIKVVAFAQFSTDRAAAAAVQSLHGVTQKFLGSSPLWIQQIYSVIYDIGARQFSTVKGELDRLRDAYDKECKIRYYDHADPVCVRIYGPEPKSLGSAKAELEMLLRGEVLVREGQDVWDDYFDTPSSEKVLQRINADPAFFIKCDTRMHTVRLWGSAADRDRARTLIFRILTKLERHRHVLPLCVELLHPLLNGGLRSLHNDVGPEKVTLDVAALTLTIRGEKDVVQKVEQATADMASSLSPKSIGENSEGLCPICFCEPTNITTLPCGHGYCRVCLRHLLQSAIGPSFSPLKCLAETPAETDGEERLPCPADIPYGVVHSLLSSTEEQKLLESSFLSYVRAHPSEFRYCPTPDCQVVYRPGERGTVFHCPICLARICVACHVEFHEGLTCAEYSDNSTSSHEGLPS